MLSSYLVGISVTVAVLLVWVRVQNAWRVTFIDDCPANDVLLGRHRCDGAGCDNVCSQAPQEEFR